MMETYFEAAHTLTRLRSGPTGPFVDGFADSLSESGYARATAREYLRAAAHLGAWMGDQDLHLDALGEDDLLAFGAHLGSCVCSKRNGGIYDNAVAGARHFLSYLRGRGVLPPSPAPAGSEVPRLVAQFEGWMRRHRGVTTSTLGTYRLILVELARKVGEPDRFTAASLRKFVSDRAALHGQSRAKTVVTAVRMFVRYLASHGLCEARLVDAIPTIAYWRLSSLPAYLPAEEVERLVHAPDPATPAGRRDRAILLLLARLGLRAGDVVGLRLGDIDWKGGTLVVCGKGRRAARLPLPQDVGDAILEHLRDGRPTLDDDHVFLRIRAPHQPLQCSKAVADIVRLAAARAGVRPPCRGAHVLRHSAATAMVRSGVPLAAIRMLLRHRSEGTTAHYAKVDVPALRRIARPWPLEVSSC